MAYFVFKQKPAYEVRISDWSSDVCSSDLDIVPDVDGYRGRGGIANCVESGSIGENALRELKLRDIEQSGRRRFGLGCGRRERQGADGKKQQGDEATHRYLPKFGEWAAVSVAAKHRSGDRKSTRLNSSH